MKKTDQNIIMLTLICALAIIMWTFIQYSKSQESVENIEEIDEKTEESVQEEHLEETDRFTEEIIPHIAPSKLKQRMNAQEEITIIDMRSSSSYETGHIRGSFSADNIDPSTITREVILVTSTGNEDLIINKYRELSQTKTVKNLTGGINAWKKEGNSLISLKNTRNFTTSGKVHFIEPRDLSTIIESGQTNEIIIIDTRRTGNYNNGHIQNAINIPLTEIEFRHNEIPRGKKIYVYGADDDASFQSGVILYDLQHIGVKTITGGFTAWQEYGYPITK